MIDLVDERDAKRKSYECSKQLREEGKMALERPKYKDDELLGYLLQFWQENGKVPTAKDFDNNPKCPSSSTYQKHFGSWNKAIEIAGLSGYRVRVRILDNELLEYLIQFWKENGRAPTKMDFINNPKYPSPRTYQLCFGSWSKALKLVGLDVDSMIMKGIIENDQQKARLFELLVLKYHKGKAIDVSGDNCRNPVDGICPKGQIYDVKSSSLRHSKYFCFHLTQKGGVDFYYLGAFDKEYKTILHVWRIPGNFTDESFIIIGVDNCTYNFENMRKYEITDKFKDIFQYDKRLYDGYISLYEQ